MKEKTLRLIGIILSVLGTLMFVFIGAVSIWGDIEATFFNASLQSDTSLKTLRCPPVITTDEVGIVSANITNTDDKPHTIDVRAYVTDGFITLMNEYLAEVTLEPNESERLEWPVVAENAAYERLILVRVHQMKEYPLPYMNASCGIVVINLPFLTGNQLTAMIVILAFFLSGGGILLWALNEDSNVWIKMIIFSISGCLFTVAGLFGKWFLGLFIFIVWILMGVGMIWQYLNPLRSKLPN